MRRFLLLLLACGCFANFPSVFAEQPRTVQFLNSGKIPSPNFLIRRQFLASDDVLSLQTDQHGAGPTTS